MADRRTAILVVLDGLGDRPHPDFEGQTPLQAAETPNFDKLASEGQTGLVDIIGPGIPPGSDTGHLSLFGYDPKQYYSGRGPLEALGAGLQPRPGDVAFRANFSTVDGDFKVVDRRAGRFFTSEEHAALQQAIDGLVIDDIKVRFITTVQHRGALVLEGDGLSAAITDVDPHEVGKKILKSEPVVPDAKTTAHVVNELIHIAHEKFEALSINDAREKRGLPRANALLVRGAGVYEAIPTFQDMHGVKAAVIAGGSLYIGAAKLVGMDHLIVEGQTGTIDTNFVGKGDKTADAVRLGYDFVFTHIKATDNAGHDFDFEKKKLAIERSDTMVGRIIDRVGGGIVLAITGDHSTPVTVGIHTSDPVPILLWSDFLRADNTTRFSEFDAAQGALNSIRGLDVMPILLGYAGIARKYGS